MARMHPAAFPHDLTAKPKLEGEMLVYRALESGLGDAWTVFYDRPIAGTRRRVDFLCLSPTRGVLAIEVKGGMVHAARGWFRQLIQRPGIRKRIDPFGQVKAGVREALAALGAGDVALPLHLAIWLPMMGQGAFTWSAPTPHIFTREVLAPERLQAMLAEVLTGGTTEMQRAAIDALITKLGS